MEHSSTRHPDSPETGSLAHTSFLGAPTRGFTFLCSDNTERECLERMLVGTNPHPSITQTLRLLSPGDYIFWYNYSSCVLRGPFIALTRLTEDIEPNAWQGSAVKRPFPLQVRIGLDSEVEGSIGIKRLSNLVPIRQTRLGPMPPVVLGKDALKLLLAEIQSTVTLCQPKENIDTFEGRCSDAFIFLSDQATAARCMDLGVMGAPASRFRDVVSEVLPQSSVLLWNIHTQEMHGVWRARSRGRFDPTVFREYPERNLTAIVECDRVIRFKRPLSRGDVSAIVAFESGHPVMRIPHASLEILLEKFLQKNSDGSELLPTLPTGIGRFLADDGHRVRSQGELIIDNMLFSKGVLHAYETRVQINSEFIRCDFFIPESDNYRQVYVEYWGLVGVESYDLRRLKKLKLYGSARIVPLEIFPRDLMILTEAWLEKIRLYRH